MKILSLTHWNVSDTIHKFQQCTSNLTFTTHESNYVHRYVRTANSFSYKAICSLPIGHFGLGCIIQYRWIFCPSHIEMCLISSTNISFVHLIKQVLIMNQTIYIATWDREIFFKTKPYWRWEIKILTKDTSFHIAEMLSLNHWNVSDNGHKYQLCTSNLRVPTHESYYVYRYVRSANSFSYKAIYALANGHFQHRCIIQYHWKFTHWNVSDTFNNFSYVHLI